MEYCIFNETFVTIYVQRNNLIEQYSVSGNTLFIVILHIKNHAKCHINIRTKSPSLFSIVTFVQNFMDPRRTPRAIKSCVSDIYDFRGIKSSQMGIITISTNGYWKDIVNVKMRLQNVGSTNLIKWIYTTTLYNHRSLANMLGSMAIMFHSYLHSYRTPCLSRIYFL